MPNLPQPARTLVRLCALAALCACSPAQTRIFDLDLLDPPVAGSGNGQPQAGRSGRQGSTAGMETAGKEMFGTAGDNAPHLDPNAAFRWTETTPGHGTCEPRRFVGNFSCDVTPGLIETRLEGSINLEFGGSSENTTFPVSKGRLFAFVLDDMRVLLEAPLTGELNCAARTFKAELTRTPTEVLPLETQIGWLILFTSSQLNTTGTLSGRFDSRALTISGDVTLQFDPQPKCIGHFELFTTQ